MRAFGEEVCERGHIVPAKLSVRRYVRTKYACPKGHAIKTAPMPDVFLSANISVPPAARAIARDHDVSA